MSFTLQPHRYHSKMCHWGDPTGALQVSCLVHSLPTHNFLLACMPCMCVSILGCSTEKKPTFVQKKGCSAGCPCFIGPASKLSRQACCLQSLPEQGWMHMPHVCLLAGCGCVARWAAECKVGTPGLMHLPHVCLLAGCGCVARWAAECKAGTAPGAAAAAGGCWGCTPGPPGATPGLALAPAAAAAAKAPNMDSRAALAVSRVC